jgi:hypothetical protein
LGIAAGKSSPTKAATVATTCDWVTGGVSLRSPNGAVSGPFEQRFSRQGRWDDSRVPRAFHAFRGKLMFICSVFRTGLPDALERSVNSVLKLLEFQFALAFQLGEFVLLAAYVGVPTYFLARFGRSAIASTATTICAAALVLHCCGFKVFGRPVTASIEKLERPKRVNRLETPNVVHFADGSTAALAHVFFPVSFNPKEKHPGHYDTARSGGRGDVLLEHDDPKRRGIAVEIKFDQSGTADLIYLRRASYTCGNTWTPHPFPSRLPKEVRDEFAVLLVRSGLALPTAERVDSSKRYDPLLGALTIGFLPDLPRAHPEVVRLGMALIRQGVRDKGVELLVLTRATNVFPQLKRTLQDEVSTKARAGTLDSATSNTLAALLLQLDAQAALTALDELRSTPQPDAFQIWSLANVVARAGDLRGFDRLCDILRADSTSKWAKHLSLVVNSHFRFDIYLNGGGWPDDIAPEFLAWYDAIRPRLSYVFSSDGREGFALDNGEAFAHEYYGSMRPYKEQIAKRHGRDIYKERFYD